VLFFVLGAKVEEKILAGELLIQWFEMNREVLLSRGFTIHQLIRNPDAYWIEPSAYVEFETDYFLGDMDVRIDGSCIVCRHPMADLDSPVAIEYPYVFLDQPAIDFRLKNSFQGIEKDYQDVEIYEIHSVNDYDPILEPFITKVTTNPGEPT
jgi:hypothetical protein